VVEDNNRPSGLIAHQPRRMCDRFENAGANVYGGNNPSMCASNYAKTGRIHLPSGPTLHPGCVGRDAGRIAEVLARLARLVGSDVTVTLEIAAGIPNGPPEDVVHTVIENAHTLKISDQGFESDYERMRRCSDQERK
jgi:hypothetical protein